jgi:hypothetical protein
MNSISKILVLAAAIAAASYTGYRVRQCRVLGTAQPPLAGPVAQAVGTVNPPDLIYPNANVADQLKLGYEVFTRQENGEVNVLPLPPHSALRTTFVLHIAPQQAYMAVMADPRCESDLLLKAYRPDAAEPVWQGKLKALGKSGPSPLDLSGISDAGFAVMTLEIDSTKAQNNWFCNVLISGA